MHRLIRRLAFTSAVALGLVVPVSGVLASGHLAYSVKGIEYAADATNAYFAGKARSADDRALWQAHVVHSGFEATTNDADIAAGGSFYLDGRKRDIVGTFIDGTVDGTPSTGCGTETFDVDATLAAWVDGDTHSGVFDGTLTHYRKIFFGSCVTFAATIVGTVVFTDVP